MSGKPLAIFLISRERAAVAAALLVAVAIAAGGAAAADAPPRFALPVDCALGKTCWVMKYVDHDPGPERADFRCGRKSSDGHQGTDFMIPGMAAMEAGVPVLAAAPGRVLRVRDGMEDAPVRELGPESVKGRDCGNGIVVDHGDGWQTQYCHLRRDSLRVAPGDTVTAGQAMGLVGLSGMTDRPHVHLTVRHDGALIDPFTGAGAVEQGCAAPVESLWRDDLAAGLAYRPVDIVAAGIAGAVPEGDDMRAGRYPGAAAADAGALVLWTDILDLRDGDRLEMRLTGPDGSALAEKTIAVDRSTLLAYPYIGRRRPDAGWPAGHYAGTVRVVPGPARAEAGGTGGPVERTVGLELP